MKPNLRKRYCNLRSGAHVVMVLNASNIKASITTAMVAATCKLLHIPVICAAIGHESSFLSRSLGPRNVMRINYPLATLARRFNGRLSVDDNPYKMVKPHKLQSLVQNSRKNNAILLLDAHIGDDFDGGFLVDSMQLNRKDTISIVWPICNEFDVEIGSRVVGQIKPEQCMVHLHDFGFAEVRKSGMCGQTPWQFPIWQSHGLTDEMMDVMKKADPYSYLPPLPELPKYYDDFMKYILSEHKAAILNTLNYVYSAAEVTYKHVFQYISEELV